MCTVTFTLRPLIAGLRSASLGIASNGGGITLPVSGTGVAVAVPPARGTSATTLSFGNVSLGAYSATQTVTLTNTGGGTLTLATLTPGGANSGDFIRGGTCANGASLAAAPNCTIVYQFAPTATGARAATLAIASNAGSTTLSLSGTGFVTPTVPVLGASAATLAIASNGGSATITLTGTGTNGR